MYVKTEVEGFSWLECNCWSGAVDTLNVIKEHGKEDEFINWLETMFFDYHYDELPTLTELNDYLWFEDEEIFEALGIGEEEDDDEEEEDEE